VKRLDISGASVLVVTVVVGVGPCTYSFSGSAAINRHTTHSYYMHTFPWPFVQDYPGEPVPER